VDSIPVWVRAGAVIPKIPEDVMTLVPAKESGNTAVKTLDDRRVYEVIGSASSEGTKLTDFEGRALVGTANSLKMSGGPAARVTVRWRFGTITSAAVNGSPATIRPGPDGPSIDFAYTGETTITWQ
jgi:alpha-D-xyloside xylohydrolase